jgi:hypothetical protein
VEGLILDRAAVASGERPTRCCWCTRPLVSSDPNNPDGFRTCTPTCGWREPIPVEDHSLPSPPGPTWTPEGLILDLADLASEVLALRAEIRVLRERMDRLMQLWPAFITALCATCDENPVEVEEAVSTSPAAQASRGPDE